MANDHQTRGVKLWEALNSVTGSMVASSLADLGTTVASGGLVAGLTAMTGSAGVAAVGVATLFGLTAAWKGAKKREQAAAEARKVARLLDNQDDILAFLRKVGRGEIEFRVDWTSERSIAERCRDAMADKFAAVMTELEESRDTFGIYLNTLDLLTREILTTVVGTADDVHEIKDDVKDIKKTLTEDRLSAATSLHQIRPPVKDFVGRKDEFQRLLEAARDGGATITGMLGMGGIGKTELACKLAEALHDDYPDAQIYVNLRGADEQTPLTPAEALAKVIQAFHPDARLPEDLDELRGLYHSVLHDKRAVLLMDNARDAKQVRPLIPPKCCALLVTSRQQITLPGMHSENLDRLTPDEARDLLLAIDPRINGVAENIAELCGCLPLALRLAGGALATRRDLAPTDYAAQLQDERTRLSKLTEVEASIALSDKLLPDDLRPLWYALAVFPADFGWPGPAAVWKLDEDPAREALGTLLAYSVIEWDQKTERYRLHDFIRLYTHQQLSESDRTTTRRRHAEHYTAVLALADDMYLKGGENVLKGLGLFDQEWANIAAGFKWVRTHMESDEHAARLCRAYPDAGAYCLDLRLHARDQIAWLEAALAAARVLYDRAAEGNYLGSLGLAYADLGDARKAIEYHEQRLVIAREIGDRRGEGNARGNLGSAYAALGDARGAIECHEQQLAISREIGDRRGEGNALGNLGLAYFALGNARKAIEYAGQVLAIVREIGNRRGEGVALGNLGSAYYALGDAPKAIECYEQQLVIVSQLGDRRGEANVAGGLGVANVALGNARKAIEYCKQQLAITREIGDRRGEASTLGNLGNAYFASGDALEAIDCYAQQLVRTCDIGDRRGEADALGNLGVAYGKLGKTSRAIEYYEQQLVLTREIGDRRGEGAALGNMGNAHAALGDARQAIEHYEQQFVIAREIGDRSGEATTRWNMGVQYAKSGDLSRAVELMQVYVDYAREIGHADAEERAALVADLRRRLAAGEGA